MMEISIDVRVSAWQRTMNSLVRNQLPQATKETLDGAAFAARAAVQRSMTQKFTIRNRGLLKGVGLKKANKRDWPRQRAVVGTRDALWVPHQTGGTFRPSRSQFHAIPTRRVKRTKSGKVRKNHSPRRIIEKGTGHFAGQSIRLNDYKRRERRAPTMYLLRRSIRIRPTLGFEETVRVAAQRHMPARFRSELTKALRTAKPR